MKAYFSFTFSLEGVAYATAMYAVSGIKMHNKSRRMVVHDGRQLRRSVEQLTRRGQIRVKYGATAHVIRVSR